MALGQLLKTWAAVFSPEDACYSVSMQLRACGWVRTCGSPRPLIPRAARRRHFPTGPVIWHSHFLPQFSHLKKWGGGVVFDIPQGFMVRVPPTRARPLGEMDENTPCLVTPPLHRVRPRVGGLQVVGREEKTPENVGAALESNQSSSNGGSAPGSLCDLQQVALPLCASTAPSGKCRPCSAYLTGLF